MNKISTFKKAMIVWLTFYTAFFSILYFLRSLRKLVGSSFSLCVVTFLLLPVVVFLFLLLQDNLYSKKPVMNTFVSVGLPGLQNDDTAILFESQDNSSMSKAKQTKAYIVEKQHLFLIKGGMKELLCRTWQPLPA